jgi:hypothetical protein
MSRKITIRELRSLIREVSEDADQVDSLVDATGATRLSNNSVDDQIDSMLIDFESYSFSAEPDPLEESLANLAMSHILLEQDAEDEEEPEEETNAPENDEPEESETPEEETGKREKPNLDVDAFTKRVVRLAKNYEVLLDVKTVVVNRAIAFLEENYEKEEIDEFKQVLDNQFDFNLEGPPEVPEAPLAIGAGGPGGGLGGGG